MTKKAFISYLNELGTPEADKHSNGGRIPDHAQYGEWLYRNDSIAFHVALHEHQGISMPSHWPVTDQELND